MFTSAECRMRAEQKLAQADHDSRNRKRLITAAEGWLFLASQLRRLEGAFENDEVVPEDAQRLAWKLKPAKRPKDEPALGRLDVGRRHRKQSHPFGTR